MWVYKSTSLRLENGHCHGYNNKHVAKIVEQSWIKKQQLTITFTRETGLQI